MERRSPGAEPIPAGELTIAPANEASFEDLQLILRGEGRRCQCQRFKQSGREYFYGATPPREEAFKEQSRFEQPDAPETTGIVAYLEDEPVAWCAVEPRRRLFRESRHPVPWKGRTENRDDESIWAITCVTVRPGWRGRGLMFAMIAAARDLARERGARIVEGYPMVTEPGKEIIWHELHVGSVAAFEAAGFELVTQPTLRRRVMRVRF